MTMLAMVSAQGQIKGRVMLPDGNPATYATVLVYADSNTVGTPLAYALTDSKGNFVIKTAPKKGYWLVVRYLGYKEHRTPLPLDKPLIEITLKKDVKNLNTVKVEAEYKSVEVSGDTIKFNTEYYKTGAEDNAAELLNKIPGMEVDDNGEVSYGGQKVDKITIDGKDLFSSGSDGALNTLSADAIQGAEILRNARGNSIIDDYTGRELTTLNLKTDGRTRLNGKVSAMGGAIGKAKSENSLLLIGKRLSLTSILSANNTGEAVFSFNDYLRHIVGLDNLLSNRGKGFSFSDDELALLMPPGNVYRSLNGVATVSGNWQPSDKLKVKGNIIANANIMDAESSSLQEFFTLGLTNTHNTAESNGNTFFSGQLQETWKPMTHIELSNRTRFTNTTMQSFDTLMESGLAAMTTLQNSDMRKWGIDDELVLNIEKGDNLLSAHLSASHSMRNYSYALTADQPLLPLAYYTLSGDGYTFDGDRQIGRVELSPDISYALKLGNKYTLTTTLAYTLSRSTFSYTPSGGDTIDESLVKNALTLGVELNKNKGLFRFTVGADGVVDRYSSDPASQFADIDNKPVSILPRATLTLAFSGTHRLSLTASQSLSDIEIERLLRTPMVNGYNSLYGGSFITDPRSKADNISLNYYIFDLYSNTLFYAAAGITNNHYTLKPYTSQDSTIVTLTRYNNDGSMATRYVTGQLSKGLGHFPADLRVGGMLTETESQTAVNAIDGEVTMLSWSTSVDLVTRSKKALNGELGFSYQTTNSHYASFGSLTSRMEQYGGHAAVIVTVKQFRGELRYSYTHLQNDTYLRQFHDIAFRAEYRIGNWRLLLRGSNLMHLDSFDWISQVSTDYYLSSTRYRKVPGYLVAGLAYRF